MIIALAGNQNCGKTTLFNALTGANQHVGNFPGVTVDRRSGEIRGQKDAILVDLPGTYSIRSYSEEENITRDFLLKEKPDGILNIVDATNPERNLYLTFQLLTLEIPTVICLNMMDEVTKNGGKIDTKLLSQLLGVPVLPISASKNEGVKEAAEEIVRIAGNKLAPSPAAPYISGPVHTCIRSIMKQLGSYAGSEGISAEFCAYGLTEGDESLYRLLSIGENEKIMIEKTVSEMEKLTGLDRNTAVASARYASIGKLCEKTVIKAPLCKEKRRSEAIDRLLTGKYTAFPVFILILLTVFYLTFNVLGSFLSDLFATGTAAVTTTVDTALTAYGVNPVIHSLIIDGIFAGVGSVLSFLPVIIVLFFFLSVLEDTGYMARIAYIMDMPMRKSGLSGKSIVPLLIGFGCTVPAVMASRTLSSDRDKKMTVLLTPFMSCSAKIPIYAVFSKAFFPGREPIIMTGLYLTGLILGAFTAMLMKRTVFAGEPVPFLMELPVYRLPSPKSIAKLLWEKAKDFLQKAFTVIFSAAIIIWFLESFDLRLHYTDDPSFSLLGSVGAMLNPVFRPLGFEDWRIPTALLSGFSAKEAVISTLSVLMKVEPGALGTQLSSLFTPSSAISFLVFALLYTPCIAAVTTIRRELGSVKIALASAVFQCLTAWCFSYLIYSVCSKIMF